MSRRAPTLPYSCQWIGSREIRAVSAILSSERITQGPIVPEFEKRLSARVRVPYCAAVSSGTAALHLAALALGLNPGDEVITTPISFLATANAIFYAGAKPVFVDIDPETLCLDPALIPAKINSKTRAIFVTHFAGHPADMVEIKSVARKYGLKVIEDAAHALGAVYRGDFVGQGRYSDATVFSFHPVKHITTGEGGAVVTRDAAIHEQVCELRTHGVTRDFRKMVERNPGPWHYEMHRLGYNYRLTDVQAAIGVVQLDRLPVFLKKRRRIAADYGRLLADVDEIALPTERKGVQHVYHLYPVRLKLESLAWTRRQIFEALTKEGIGVQVHYIPIPAQPFYRRLGYTTRDLPEACRYYEEAVSIPLYPKMTAKDVARVVKTLKTVLRKGRKSMTRNLGGGK